MNSILIWHMRLSQNFLFFLFFSFSFFFFWRWPVPNFFLPFSFPFFFLGPLFRSILFFISFLTAVKSWELIIGKAWKYNVTFYHQFCTNVNVFNLLRQKVVYIPPGGVLKKFNTGGLRPEVQPLPFYIPFSENKVPLSCTQGKGKAKQIYWYSHKVHLFEIF